MNFSLSDSAIEVNALREALQDDRAGAYVGFEGRVRNTNEGFAVTALFYEAYVPLAEKEGLKVLEEASEKFELIDAMAVHRIGKLLPGELAVWVGVLSGHRDAAYAASRYIIDELKTRVPIWKNEQYEDKSAEWIGNEE